jgi:hypothetical protein
MKELTLGDGAGDVRLQQRPQPQPEVGLTPYATINGSLIHDS